MDPNDRQRFKILFILLAVLLATVWVGRQMYQVSSVAPASVLDAGAASPPGTDDFLVAVGLGTDGANGVSVPADESGRNPFRYGPRPSPPVSVSDGPPAVTLDSGNNFPAPDVVVEPALPPAPPRIPFRYNGYAVIDQSGDITAFLFDDDGYFAVSEQDVLMGRYRISVVTEAFVEVEDLEYGRPERLPLIIQ